MGCKVIEIWETGLPNRTYEISITVDIMDVSSFVGDDRTTEMAYEMGGVGIKAMLDSYRRFIHEPSIHLAVKGLT
jgi:hypothetical protein